MYSILSDLEITNVIFSFLDLTDKFYYIIKIIIYLESKKNINKNNFELIRDNILINSIEIIKYNDKIHTTELLAIILSRKRVSYFYKSNNFVKLIDSVKIYNKNYIQSIQNKIKQYIAKSYIIHSDIENIIENLKILNISGVNNYFIFIKYSIYNDNKVIEYMFNTYFKYITNKKPLIKSIMNELLNIYNIKNNLNIITIIDLLLDTIKIINNYYHLDFYINILLYNTYSNYLIVKLHQNYYIRHNCKSLCNLYNTIYENSYKYNDITLSIEETYKELINVFNIKNKTLSVIILALMFNYNYDYTVTVNEIKKIEYHIFKQLYDIRFLLLTTDIKYYNTDNFIIKILKKIVFNRNTIEQLLDSSSIYNRKYYLFTKFYYNSHDPYVSLRANIILSNLRIYCKKRKNNKYTIYNKIKFKTI